jgi:hypothetical protein
MELRQDQVVLLSAVACLAFTQQLRGGLIVAFSKRSLCFAREARLKHI